jgi:hypothetical protein
MAPSQIRLWRCIFGSVRHNTLRKIINLLSKIKFDGEGETSTNEHNIKFYLNSFFFFIILLMKVSYAGCSLLLLKAELKYGVILCRPPLFTYGNNLYVNFCMLLKIMMMMNCVKKY